MHETQDSPVQDGHDDATNEQELDGIVEQVRSDLGSGHTHESALEMLRQRTTESKIEVSEERLRELAERLSSPS